MSTAYQANPIKNIHLIRLPYSGPEMSIWKNELLQLIKRLHFLKGLSENSASPFAPCYIDDSAWTVNREIIAIASWIRDLKILEKDGNYRTALELKREFRHRQITRFFDNRSQHFWRSLLPEN